MIGRAKYLKNAYKPNIWFELLEMKPDDLVKHMGGDYPQVPPGGFTL